MRFEYYAPRTMDEAFVLLDQYHDRAKVIAGGTDLLAQIDAGVHRPEHVIDIEGVGLSYLSFDHSVGLKIGAATPLRTLESSDLLKEKYPAIRSAAGEIGSVAIRNVGTLGGNICNASPCADSVPALIGLGAGLKIVGSSGERVVPLEAFFTGPGLTLLQGNELLAEVQVPLPPSGTQTAYIKHKIRDSIDLAIVNVAAMTLMDDGVCRDAKLVVGSAGPTVFRAREAEHVLEGNALDDELIRRAAVLAAKESKPITDSRASAEYRRAMIEVLTCRAIQRAESFVKAG
jgi:carbon-monoxide dehydrogenase medium subunit